jgi:hypothetical protein
MSTLHRGTDIESVGRFFRSLTSSVSVELESF